jgi:hypothetical protein
VGSVSSRERAELSRGLAAAPGYSASSRWRQLSQLPGRPPPACEARGWSNNCRCSTASSPAPLTPIPKIETMGLLWSRLSSEGYYAGLDKQMAAIKDNLTTLEVRSGAPQPLDQLVESPQTRHTSPHASKPPSPRRPASSGGTRCGPTSAPVSWPAFSQSTWLSCPTRPG